MATTLKAVTARLGYQQIASLSSATGLTVPTTTTGGLSARPSIAMIIAETAAVRWRDDGVAPTATVGMPLAIGATLQYDGDIGAIQFIEQTAGAKLNVSYYV
jgi:hypothetical protein